MIFSGIVFLYYFLPITLLCYLVVPKQFKNLILLVSSLCFYAWGEKVLVFLFAFSIFTGWGVGLLMEKTKKPLYRKLLMLFALFYDLGILGYFKYMDFFISASPEKPSFLQKRNFFGKKDEFFEIFFGLYLKKAYFCAEFLTNLIQ